VRDGIERDRIESIVAELGMSDFTIFPGRLGDDALPVYYAAADVCVVPSHYEPFGLVAIEAMAVGRQWLQVMWAVYSIVVPEQTGLLAPPMTSPLLQRLTEFSQTPFTETNSLRQQESGNQVQLGRCRFPIKRTIYRAFGTTS